MYKSPFDRELTQVRVFRGGVGNVYRRISHANPPSRALQTRRASRWPQTTRGDLPDAALDIHLQSNTGIRVGAAQAATLQENSVPVSALAAPRTSSLSAP